MATNPGVTPASSQSKWPTPSTIGSSPDATIEAAGMDNAVNTATPANEPLADLSANDIFAATSNTTDLATPTDTNLNQPSSVDNFQMLSSATPSSGGVATENPSGDMFMQQSPAQPTQRNWLKIGAIATAVAAGGAAIWYFMRNPKAAAEVIQQEAPHLAQQTNHATAQQAAQTASSVIPDPNSAEGQLRAILNNYQASRTPLATPASRTRRRRGTSRPPQISRFAVIHNRTPGLANIRIWSEIFGSLPGIPGELSHRQMRQFVKALQQSDLVSDTLADDFLTRLRTNLQNIQNTSSGTRTPQQVLDHLIGHRLNATPGQGIPREFARRLMAFAGIPLPP